MKKLNQEGLYDFLMDNDLLDCTPEMQCLVDGKPAYLYTYNNYEDGTIEEIEMLVDIENTNDLMTFEDLFINGIENILTFTHRVYRGTVEHRYTLEDNRWTPIGKNMAL